MKIETTTTTKLPYKKDGTLEFPISYYQHHELGITRSMIDEVLVKQYKLLYRKVRDSVNFNLRNGFLTDQAKDLLNDAIASTLERFEKNLLIFHTQNKFVGYVLITAWRENRRREKKDNPKLKAPKKPSYLEALEQELEGFFPEQQSSKRRLVDLDSIQELSNSAPEYMESELFKSDSHIEFLYEQLWSYLDDSVLDGQFTLREATIYKLYIVNEYSIARMAEQTNFSRTSIVSALSKIKKQLATVDWQPHKYKAPPQERYNDDPFDFEL